MRQKKKIEIDKDISKLTKELLIVNKKYNDVGLTHLVFKNIPDELKIDKETERGRRVLTSYYPESHDIFLVKFNEIGEVSYPYGGIKVYNRTLNEFKEFYPESVVKHKNIEFNTRNLE
jgi:hypothetical protein